MVATINTVYGHFDVQKNGVTITLTGAGTVASPWVCNLTIPAGSGTDNHIVRWDGTTGIQDSAVTIADTTGAMLTPTLYATGTVAAPVAGTDTYGTLTQGSGFPRVEIGKGTEWAYLTHGLLAWNQTTNEGILQPPTLTADRTWTLPDATGTVLLSSTASTSLPAHSAASRVWLSGSGGTGNIEGVAERGLSIDADGIGLSALAAASRVYGSGSGGTAILELVAERGLDIDANGIGVATAGITAAMLAASQSPQYASRNVTVNTNDTATSADHTIFLSNNSLFAGNTADAYTPTGLAGKVLIYVYTASLGQAYTIRDHAAATLHTLSAAGESCTITTDGTNWYLTARV